MTTEKQDYTELDKLMLQLIEAGGATASRLTLSLVQHTKAFETKSSDGYRVIDRRLQALRKKALIACVRVGRDTIWSIKPQA